MRVAVISDIHGNLISLEAVLADLARAGVEEVVCLGDVAAGGPQPHEVMLRLRELACPCVLGNTDADAVRQVRSVPLDEEGRRWVEIDGWCASRLSAEDLALLRSFRSTITLSLDDHASMLCFHGSPRSNIADIFPATPDNVLARMLAGHGALVMAGGHTHVPFVRRYRQALLLNPGSVGLPFEVTVEGTHHLPWAEYAIVEHEAGRLSAELRRLPIDADRVAQAILQSGMPHAEWLAARWR